MYLSPNFCLSFSRFHRIRTIFCAFCWDMRFSSYPKVASIIRWWQRWNVRVVSNAVREASAQSGRFLGACCSRPELLNHSLTIGNVNMGRHRVIIGTPKKLKESAFCSLSKTRTYSSARLFPGFSHSAKACCIFAQRPNRIPCWVCSSRDTSHLARTIRDLGGNINTYGLPSLYDLCDIGPSPGLTCLLSGRSWWTSTPLPLPHLSHISHTWLA